MDTSQSSDAPPQGLIDDHALIGDGITSALVRFDGTIDWLCWPRFDSPACLASLLGTADNGHWSIRPVAPVVQRRRRYVADTLVLETEWETASGTVRITDFMPVGDGPSSIIRSVLGVRGTVRMSLALCLRFDHGRLKPWVESLPDGGMSATVGPHRVVLHCPIPFEPDATTTSTEWDTEAGQTTCFVLSCSADSAPAVDVTPCLSRTIDYWRSRLACFDKPTDWPEAVRRSLLTLLALVHRPTGGIVAAPTTSLPERAGGTSNWDYRYCWLRDATFTMGALLNAGLHQEATAWRSWLLRALGGDPAKLRIAYRVDGACDLDEREIDWLPGYRGSRPVRSGNAAWRQHQLDVFGEVIDCLSLAVRGGLPASEQASHVKHALLEQLEAVWQRPGQGLWESRGEPKHYVYSKVMAWVGIDRCLRRSHCSPLSVESESRLRELGDRMRAEICDRGYHSGRGTFVQHYDGDELDASLLLLPALGFLPATDDRMARTIAAIQRELVVDGLVMRTATPEGSQPEGAFLACTCWLADCLAMQGRHAEARATFERVLATRNDLGLLSEEFDLERRCLAGNFPQALTHLALVNTALSLCGPVLQRAA